MDIAFVVGMASKFMSNLGKKHYERRYVIFLDGWAIKEDVVTLVKYAIDHLKY